MVLRDGGFIEPISGFPLVPGRPPGKVAGASAKWMVYP